MNNIDSLIIQRRVFLIIAAFSILLIIGMLILLFTFLFSPKQKNNTSPSTQTSPTKFYRDPSFKNNPSTIQSSPEYIKSTEEIESKNSAVLKKEGSIGRLLTKLPYKGQFFSVEYNYARDIFYITISSSNQKQGNIELDAFLNTNGISNRSLIRNIQISYKELSPAP